MIHSASDNGKQEADTSHGATKGSVERPVPGVEGKAERETEPAVFSTRFFANKCN